MTTITCTTCHERFNRFDGDDDTTCLQCLDKMDEAGTVEVSHVAPQALIDGVKRYASDNYESGKGWDHVIETMDDAEIAGYIGKARTVNGAIWAVWNKRVRFIWQMNRDNRWLEEEREAERKAALADAVWAAVEDSREAVQ